MITGKQKTDKIEWTDSFIEDFRASQKALQETKSIVLPTLNDQLIIVHDGSKIGIGSVLYVIRNGIMKLGGYFSAKLKSHQSRWLPCEIEALSVSTSVRHFAPYIRQSIHPTQVLTDNKPCIQAWSKMKRGEFSSSARVATFLTVLSDFNIELHHISGTYNLPSDFFSRNPMDCDSSSCQICSYVSESENAAVRSVTINDILSGKTKLPYTNRSTWKKLQMECPDLRRTHAHLSQGTRPSTKNTKLTTTKRYLQKVHISKDGLLVTKEISPFLPDRELIVVPQHLLRGLLTSLHIRFDHPTSNELQKLFHRNFFALKLFENANNVTNACSQCQSLKTIPRELFEQVGKPSPSHPCTEFAADVIRRYKQFIFIMRDTFSSFTLSTLICNEKHDSIREAIIDTVTKIRPSNETSITIRVDTASGIKILKDDKILETLNISIDLGRVKNKNKNPVAEKCCRELGQELLRVDPNGGPITSSVLAIATANLNSRLRGRGISAWEILHQRDQFTGEELPLSDMDLSDIQTSQREANRISSSKYKARGGPNAKDISAQIGSLVYIKTDGSKVKGRDRYIVTEILNDTRCKVQKFTKNQLRNCCYEVNLNEIYPVTPEIFENLNEPIRGLEEEESDYDYDDVSVHDQILYDVPIPANDNLDLREYPTMDEKSVPNDSEEVNNLESIRPRRNIKQPQWMSCGDYQLS